MTTPPKAAIAIAALAGAFLAGRVSAPARVVERERVVTRTVEVERQGHQDARQASQEAATRTITVTRWLRRPDGTHEAETRTEAATEARASEATVRVEYRDRAVEVAVDRWRERVVEGQRPRWSVAALGGTGLDLRPVVGAHVTRDVGPFVLGIAVVTPTADVRPVALLTAGVRW